MHFTALITLSVLVSSALASPHQTFACGAAKIGLRKQPGTDDDVKPGTCLTVNGNNAPFYEYTDGNTQPTISTTNVIPAGSTCEHILEIQVLKEVLESPGGPCDQLTAMTQGSPQRLALRQRFRELTDIINNAPNLVFVVDTLEKQKGLVALKFMKGEKFKQDPSDPNLRKRLEAVDHFLHVQTKPSTLAVARDLDAKIAQIFPGTTAKVETGWTNLLAFASTCYSHLT